MTDKKQITWRAHPVVDDFPRSIGAVILLLFCASLFYFVTGLPGFGLIAFVFFFLSTLSYFVPVKYQIDEENLSIWFCGLTNIIPLKKYRNFYVNPAGIHFSTFSTPSPLDSFRGNFVRFNRNRNEVLAFLNEVMPLEVIENSMNVSVERKDLVTYLIDIFKRKKRDE